MEHKFRICPHFRLQNLQYLQAIQKVNCVCEFSHFKHLQNAQSLWLCCHCSKIGCSLLQVDKCLFEHFQTTQHTLFYSFDFQILWCMKCELNLFQMQLQLQNYPQSKEHIYFNAALSAAKNIFKTIQSKNQLIGNSVLQIDQYSYIFGLKNLGNTCFFNSVLQIILNSEKFIENLEKKSKEISQVCFTNQLLQFEQQPQLGNVKNPQNIFEYLCKRNKVYSRFQQQDSSECFLFILDMIEDDFKLNNIDHYHQFIGKYVFQSQCLICKKKQFSFYDSSLILIDLVQDQKHEEIKKIVKNQILKKIENNQKYLEIEEEQLNITKKNEDDNFKDPLSIDLMNQVQLYETFFQQLISSYFDFQIFSQQHNGIQCENCKQKTTYVFHKHYVFNFPQYLSICFKKFHNNFQKNNLKIVLEEFIDLSNFQIIINKNKKRIKYKLYGIINHQGTLNGGHYTCYIKKKNQWYLISDSFFYKVKKEHALNSNAYLAFYEKIDN